MGQTDPVELIVDRAGVGLGGIARTGTWTPAKMQLRNNSASPRAVICQWEMDDPDGDVVRMQRAATLSPGRSQDVWVYAQPPMGARLDLKWRFTVLDKESGAVLSRANSDAGGTVSNGLRVIGVSGAVPRGLELLRNDGNELGGGSGPGSLNFGQVTQQEANQYLANLRPENLPDRWFGLSMMQAYIWTPEEGGDPGSPTISPDTIKAVREWVRRGGHLVVILPAAEDWWTQSPLADMLPGVELASRSNVRVPAWLGFAPVTAEGKLAQMEVKQIRLKDGAESRMAVLCRDDTGTPLAVAGRYGFGRVTLIGLDVTSPEIVRMGLPSGKHNIWHDIFGWRGDAIPWKLLEDAAKEGTLYRPDRNNNSSIDGPVIDSVINMKETVGPLLVGASALFAAYWFFAGPGSWYVLRRRGMERHSWVVFTGIACVFVAVAWLGALLTRPAEARIAHYSVLDLDAKSGQARVTSWATVFVPTHGRVRMEIENGEKSASGNGPSGMLTAIGSLKDNSGATFLDSQAYEMDAALPGSVDMPFRGTAKRVQIDWRGSTDSLKWALSESMAAKPSTAPGTQPAETGHGIYGKMKRQRDSVEGLLTHDLPGALVDVRVIYPSESGEPWVSAVGTWHPGDVLDLKEITTAVNEVGRPLRQRWAIRPMNQDELWTGYLGDLLRLAAGESVDPVTGQKVQIVSSNLVQSAELMSFFDNLPGPRVFSSKPISVYSGANEKIVRRGPGRVLDMSGALGLKRVIILGHMNHSPMIAPLQVNGKSMSSSGWTLVRWVGEMEQGK